MTLGVSRRASASDRSGTIIMHVVFQFQNGARIEKQMPDRRLPDSCIIFGCLNEIEHGKHCVTGWECERDCARFHFEYSDTLPSGIVVFREVLHDI